MGRFPQRKRRMLVNPKSTNQALSKLEHGQELEDGIQSALLPDRDQLDLGLRHMGTTIIAISYLFRLAALCWKLGL